MTPTVNIIVEGNSEIGLGHLYRCLGVADAFTELSIPINFIVPENSSLSVIDKYKTTILNIEIWNNISKNIEYFKSLIQQKDIVLLDLLEYKYVEFNVLCGFDIFVASLTLFHFKPNNYYGNLSIFPNISQSNNTFNNTPVLAGPNFFIIRENIYKSKKREKENNSIPKMLITMGGADTYNILNLVLDSLEKLNLEIDYILIAGKSNRKKNNLKKRVKNKDNFAFYESVKNIEEIYSQIDFAIINGGNTRYELTYLNIPYFCISIHKKQFNISQEVINIFGGVNLGVYNEITDTYIAKELFNTLTNKEKLMEIKNKMSVFSYVNGAKNICNTILNHYKKYTNETFK